MTHLTKLPVLCLSLHVQFLLSAAPCEAQHELLAGVGSQTRTVCLSITHTERDICWHMKRSKAKFECEVKLPSLLSSRAGFIQKDVFAFVVKVLYLHVRRFVTLSING